MPITSSHPSVCCCCCCFLGGKTFLTMPITSSHPSVCLLVRRGHISRHYHHFFMSKGGGGGGGGKTHFSPCPSLLHVQGGVCVWGGGGVKHISHHAHHFFMSKLHRSLLIPVPSGLGSPPVHLWSRFSPCTPLV